MLQFSVYSSSEHVYEEQKSNKSSEQQTSTHAFFKNQCGHLLAMLFDTKQADRWFSV